MPIMALLASALFCNGEGSGKVNQNLYPAPDHCQKLTSFSER